MIALVDRVQRPLCLTLRKSREITRFTGHMGAKKMDFHSNSAGPTLLIRFVLHILTEIRVVAGAVRNAG